ncbi:uncharacterized protein M421DRAFT_185921 [Didymella exigua CBS 183.55]|uniref:Uncharacterized protein n=1 Tax=Didymella exigua CBS 183.55 TaxID=1150837 RepID=A0A6A5RG04_9PLEO|nr:uncharacterized protein M421DRAFT_185921 [Didymella exigua CBS 183.55]KAF1927251.1 hypothetical protein M421DRAFT_185921 [Didymella exigua CBS 183.55]
MMRSDPSSSSWRRLRDGIGRPRDQSRTWNAHLRKHASVSLMTLGTIMITIESQAHVAQSCALRRLIPTSQLHLAIHHELGFINRLSQNQRSATLRWDNQIISLAVPCKLLLVQVDGPAFRMKWNLAFLLK